MNEVVLSVKESWVTYTNGFQKKIRLCPNGFLPRKNGKSVIQKAMITIPFRLK